MTGKDLQVSPAVEGFLAARLPGWRDRARTGHYGGWYAPVACEVCGKVFYRRISELEDLVRGGKHLPRFCSRDCMTAGMREAQP